MLRSGAVFFILALLGSAASLSCYGFSEYKNRVKVVHEASYCNAQFGITTGMSSFNGVKVNARKLAHLKDQYATHDCEKTVSTLGRFTVEAYTCLCFTSYCNFPFSAREFEKRNYTLAISL